MANDLGRIKANVSKMVSMGAPESDIDSYISGEGTSIDAVRSFKLMPDSMMNQGLGFVQQHPFKTAFQGLPETITGKSMEQRAMEAINSPDFMQSKTAPFDKFIPRAGQAAQNTIVGGQLMDQATAPINYLGGRVIEPLAKGINAMGGVIGNTLSKIPTVLNSTKGDAFANSVQQAFLGVKKSAVDKFGNQLEELAKNNPDKTVDLGNVVNDIKQNWGDLSNNAKSAFKRTPVLRDLLKNTADVTADSVPVSLEDTQKIINHLNSSVPANIKAQDLDLMHTLYDIKGTQLDAFPEMSGARQDYQKVIQPYNQVKNYFKFNRTLSAIKNNFGGDQGIEAVKKLGLPDEIIKQMGGYKNAVKFLSGTKKAAPWAGGAIVGALGVNHYSH